MKRLVQVAVLAVLAVLVVSSCTFAPMEVFGTWTMSSGGDTESLQFCLASFTLTDDYVDPAWDGTLKCSYDDIDKTAGHILLEVTDTSGWWTAVFDEGEKLYMTYAILGDSMYMEFQTGTYPTTTTWGPYIKD